MLHLIPAPLHRTALRLAHAARLRWWRWRQPLVVGCRVLAFDPAGRVLLIRHAYGSRHWMLPGGGVGRGEAPLAAAGRELLEETGCRLIDPVEFAVIDEPLSGATNRVHCITGTALGTPIPDGREVLQAAFHAAEHLPAPLTGQLAAHLAGWIRTAQAARAQPEPAAQPRRADHRPAPKA